MSTDRPVLDGAIETVAAQGVEITPEMVSAGVGAFDFYSRSVDSFYLVEQVYIAMELARLQSSSCAASRC